MIYLISIQEPPMMSYQPQAYEYNRTQAQIAQLFYAVIAQALMQAMIQRIIEASIVQNTRENPISRTFDNTMKSHNHGVTIEEVSADEPCTEPVAQPSRIEEVE